MNVALSGALTVARPPGSACELFTPRGEQTVGGGLAAALPGVHDRRLRDWSSAIAVHVRAADQDRGSLAGR